MTAAIACSLTCSQAVRSFHVQPEEPSVLRLGQTASIELPTSAGFSIGAAGTALRLVRQVEQGGRTTYVYRAVEAGDQTFVATPRAPGPDGCVSCVTVHYFITVASGQPH